MTRRNERDLLLRTCILWILTGFFSPMLFAQDDEEMSPPAEPAAPVPTILFSGNSPVGLIVARPIDNSKRFNSDFSWISAFCHEFLLFRFQAINRFKVMDPESLSSEIKGYTEYNSEAPAKHMYSSYARRTNIPYILYAEYKIEKESKTIQFNLTLQSVKIEGEQAIAASSCGLDNIDDCLDSCIRTVINLCSPAPESYTVKFLRTKITGAAKGDRLIGESRMSAYKSNKNHLRVAEDLKKYATQEQSLLANYAGAREFAKANNYNDAALLLKDLIFNLGPSYPNLYTLSTRYFRLAEKYEEALQMAKVSEGLNLSTNELILEKAICLEATNDWTNAETAYRQVMTFDENNYNALIFLIRKANRDQQSDEALKLAAAFEQKYPENGRELLEKGKALIATKQFKNAQSALSQAVSLLPKDIEAHTVLGDIFMQNGDFNSALAHYNKVIDLAPQNLDAHIKAAHTYALLANPRAALETLKKIQSKYYDNPVVQKEIGLAEFQTGDTASARRDLNRYLQSGEPDLKALVILGRIYAGLGMNEEALEMFENAMPLDDNKTAAQQRIDAVKSRMTSSGGRKAKGPIAEIKKPKKKFPLGLTIKISSGTLCVGGLVFGYLMNQKIKDMQPEYIASINTPRANELGDEMRSKEKLRNLSYGVGLVSGVVFGVTFAIPYVFKK